MPIPLKWTPDLVARFWNGISATRLDELSFSKLAGESLLECLVDFLSPGTRVLDVGAGGGDLTQLLLSRGCFVAVHEPSTERRKAIEEKPLFTHPRFLGFQDPTSDEQFDVVLAVEVIEHVLEEDLPEFLALLRKKTKNNGIVVVSTPNHEDLDLNMAYCPACDTLFHRWQHVRAFTPESLRDLMWKAGFERLHDHQIDFSHAAFADSLIRELEVKAKIASLVGPFYFLIKPILNRRAAKNRRRGSGSTLVFVGKFLSTGTP